MVPVFFDGPTASELLTGMICSCSGRNRRSRDCSCFKSGLQCTNLCSCGDDDGCGIPIRGRELDMKWQSNLLDMYKDLLHILPYIKADCINIHFIKIR